MPFRQLFLRFAAVVVGFLPGFYIMFKFVFTDIFSASDYTTAALMTLGVYAILGFLFAFFAGGSWTWGLPLSFPGIILVTLYAFKDYGIIKTWHVTVMGLGLIGACLGAFGGELLKKRFIKSTST
jgi:hypothetical protein